MSYLKKILAGRGGEGYIDVAVLILCVMLVLALSVKILPVFIANSSWILLRQNFAGRQRLRAGSGVRRTGGRLSSEKRQDLIPRFIGQPVAGFSSMRK